MMGDNKSEKFFKVLHDRMKEAQTDIKATVSVNVGEMTYKANEKELETGKTWTFWTVVTWCDAASNAGCPPFLQSSLVQVTHCWSKASPLPLSQVPLCFPSNQPRSRRRWRRRWAQLLPS